MEVGAVSRTICLVTLRADVIQNEGVTSSDMINVYRTWYLLFYAWETQNRGSNKETLAKKAHGGRKRHNAARNVPNRAKLAKHRCVMSPMIKQVRGSTAVGSDESETEIETEDENVSNSTATIFSGLYHVLINIPYMPT